MSNLFVSYRVDYSNSEYIIRDTILKSTEVPSCEFQLNAIKNIIKTDCYISEPTDRITVLNMFPVYSNDGKIE